MDRDCLASLKKKVQVLQSEHQELLAYRGYWMSSWWRAPIFLLVLLWSWHRRYRDWEFRWEAFDKEEFRPSFDDGLAICEKRAGQGNRSYISLLALFDQQKAALDRTKE